MKSRDHALAVIKAAINLVPFGGALASLIGDYMPTYRERTTEKTLVFLNDQLRLLEGRIDVEAVNKDEFSELFNSCYLIIVRTHHDEKLRAAAALLANLLLRPGDPAKVPYEELDHLVRCLDALSIGAIAVLGATRQLRTSHPSSQTMRIRIEFSQLRQKFPQMEASLLMSLVSELNALNLLTLDIPPIKISEYGNYALELSPIGERFVEQFIEGHIAAA
jgi:hypothetical protein